MTIEEKYKQKCRIPSDINEHLPVLKEYASKCEEIVELGVYTINSTWALLAGKPKKMLSIDIKHPKEYGANIQEVYDLITDEYIEYEFLQADTTQIEIPETDLLFIDTWHVYQQLKKELELHGNKSRKFIIFHDTQTYGLKDSRWGNSDKSKGEGLLKAINEFVEANPHWYIYKVYTNNNGLLILKRNG